MRFLRVQVQNWRGLEDLAIGPFSPHLNLITGPNRSGKSRLQQAIWFAMMESSKGSAAHKARLQSHSSQESPRVTVEFESAGVRHELVKQFLRNSFTRLADGNRTLEGPEAEARLQQILGTKPGGRQVDIADSGIWPLLWVNQGRAGDVPHESINEDTRHSLRESLAREVGAATIGRIGASLMEAAGQEYRRHYTQTGREGGELQSARENLRRAEQVLQEAVGKQQEVARLADEIQLLRADMISYRQRLESLQQEAQAARGRADAAAQLRAQLDTATAQVNQRAAERDQATQSVKYRSGLEAELGKSLAAHSRARESQEKLAAEVNSLSPRVEEAASSVDTAEKELEQARTVLLQVSAAARKGDLSREIARTKKLLESAREVAKKIRKQAALKASLASFADEAIEGLRELKEDSGNLQAQLKGAAVSLTITAKKDVLISGEKLLKGDSSTLSISSPTRVVIGDVAEIKVQPGGSDLADLRDQARDAARALKEKLEELAVESPGAAEKKNRELHSATEAFEQQQDRLAEMAPDGIEAIETGLAELEAQHQALDVPDELPTENQASRAARSAQESCEELRARRDELQGELGELRERHARAEQEALGLVGRLDDLRTQLAELPDADDLQEKANEATTRWEDAVAARNAIERAYGESGGDAAGLDMNRSVQALETLRSASGKAEQELNTRQGELRRAEGEGLYERRQAAEFDMEHGRTVLERKVREATAAKVLWETLTRKRQALQERLVKPVIMRVNTYLEPLFPGCRLDMTDSLEVRGVIEGSSQDGFEDLSGGEREQLSLVVRLALADVLRGDDSLPLVFDDSMVNTDAERIQVVQSLLYRAARNLQIILFTCQSTQFDRLGAEFHQALPARRRSGTKPFASAVVA